MTAINNKTIWNIGYPIILGNLAQTLIALTDTAFLGRVSAVALGASMIAGIYYFVFATLAWGFSIGIQIIVARRLGEGKLNRIGVVFEHGLAVVLLLAISLFLIQHCFTEQLLAQVIQSPNIYAATLEFMAYRHYGISFVCFNFLFRALYIGLSNTKVISFTTLLMAVVNIVLDYALIFGHWGLPEMGIGGAALASVCAEVSALLFFIGYTLIKLPLKKYALFTFHKLEGWLMKSILRLAFPTMLQKLLSFGSWFIFFILVEHLGEQQTAVSGIIRSVYMLIAVPVFAFAATSNTLTSRLIGSGSLNEIKPTLLKILRLSLICISPVLLCCLFFPQLILSVYTNDPSLIAGAIPSLYVICVAVIGMAFGLTLFEAVSGTGNTTHALWLEMGVLAVYTLSVWLFAHWPGANVALVWSCELIYGICIGLASLLYLKFASWQKKRI
ncbi:MAG: MATE family efflux transporter [Culturomica sp.]|jgi:putative MATE family efflux protein|nr:MATE family efflux transporter [Culturomica sp.]